MNTQRGGAKQPHVPRKDSIPSAPGFSRSYRRQSAHADEMSFQIVVEQTDLWITVRRAAGVDFAREALERVNFLRRQIRNWMLIDPAFGPSFSPLAVADHAPEIVRRMGEACARMGVGPMAAVAGAVASMTADHLLRFSSEVIVENGGDVMLHSTRDRVVALLPDPGQGAVLGLRISAGEFPVSVCSSSSTIGHSLSFGKGELAAVRARDAFLADAAATAFCNRLQKPEDVRRVLEEAAALPDAPIEGLFLQCGEAVGVWGNMELVAL